MSPFRNILRFSAGDLLAKSLSFLAIIYLARVLGVASFGVLEFARAALLYLLLLADAGLELWAVREAARGTETPRLVPLVVPLRLLTATAAFGLLLLLLPAFPDGPVLRTVLVLYGLTLFTQAASLKWVFLAREQMGRAVSGLVLAQVIFAASIFPLVRAPAAVVWVPVLQLAGELVMVLYFVWWYRREFPGARFTPTLRGATRVLRSSVPLGTSFLMGLMSFNLDMLLLGFFLGPAMVGWYGAAYKPVSVVLALPVSYFLGLFPVLSRAFAESRTEFRALATRSLRLTSIVALPVGVGGSFLAGPVIHLLFGAEYARSVLPLQILSWSAALVMLRGTYRYALSAAGRVGLDLRCATIAAAVNLGANLVLIPTWGLAGAAAATLTSELVWLATIRLLFDRAVMPLDLLAQLWRPALAALAMSGAFWLTRALSWPVHGALGFLTYLGALALLSGGELRSWLQPRKLPAP